MGESRVPAVRSATKLLSVATLFFLGFFLFASRASVLVTDTAAAAPDGVIFTRPPAPVVWIVFDEFPASTIMRPDGEIDKSRFPNFARLAERSHWFRNSASVASLTQFAVPALLTGERPAGGRLPIAAHYPRNLFTILGSRYQIWQYQVFTDLCPDEVCRRGPQATPVRHPRLVGALADAAVVYAYEVTPEPLRSRLPPLSGRWTGFVEDPAGTEPLPAHPIGAEPRGLGRPDSRWRFRGAERDPLTQASVIEDLVEALEPDGGASLWFAHVALPHAPWVATPWGWRNSTNPSGTTLADTTDEGQVAADAIRKRQRHLLQAMVADRLVGDLIAGMEEAGLWDRAAVVVTSDHGVSLLPPDVGRTPTERNASEVFRNLFFLKAPGQERGAVHDEFASVLDVLPTLLGTLGVDVPGRFEGRDLLKPHEPSDRSAFRVQTGRGGPKTVPTSLERFLDDVVARHWQNFPVGGLVGVAAVGDFAGMVGGPAPPSRTAEGWKLKVDQTEELSSLRLADRRVPLTITGEIEAPPGERIDSDLPVVLNGIVAGVALDPAEVGERRWEFEALLHGEVFREGLNEIAVLVPSASTGRHRGAAAAHTFRMVSPEGKLTSTGSSGARP